MCRWRVTEKALPDVWAAFSVSIIAMLLLAVSKESTEMTFPPKTSPTLPTIRARPEWLLKDALTTEIQLFTNANPESASRRNSIAFD